MAGAPLCLRCLSPALRPRRLKPPSPLARLPAPRLKSLGLPGVLWRQLLYVELPPFLAGLGIELNAMFRLLKVAGPAASVAAVAPPVVPAAPVAPPVPAAGPPAVVAPVVGAPAVVAAPNDGDDNVRPPTLSTPFLRYLCVDRVVCRGGPGVFPVTVASPGSRRLPRGGTSPAQSAWAGAETAVDVRDATTRTTSAGWVGVFW